MGNNPSYFRGKKDSDSRPVEQMTWVAIAGVAGFNIKTGFRLPTEAEWEYACRAGTTTAIHSTPAFPNGSDDPKQLKSIARYGQTIFGGTFAVGGLAPNAFGFFDMLGNVQEWCSDWYSDYTADNAMDPVGPSTGKNRVLRGGDWQTPSSDCRSSYRVGDDPSSPFNSKTSGFRAARTP